jgi:hypothetical protein
MLSFILLNAFALKVVVPKQQQESTFKYIFVNDA